MYMYFVDLFFNKKKIQIFVMTFTRIGVMDRNVYVLVKKGLFRAMETFKKIL